MQPKDYVESAKLIQRVYKTMNKNEGSKKAVQSYINRFHPSNPHFHKFGKIPLKLVAEDNGKIIGILRGVDDGPVSLYINKNYHHKGIATKLYNKAENYYRNKNHKIIKIKSSLYAVPFYQKLGFKNTTGIRSLKNESVKFQPMKKILKDSSSAKRKYNK